MKRAACIALHWLVFSLPLLGQERIPITNLEVTEPAQLSESWLVYSVWESFRGQDLNGDGDVSDQVVHVYNLESGETRNLERAGTVLAVVGSWLVISVSEFDQGEDLNGDGRLEEPDVVHVHNLESGATRNVELAGAVIVSRDGDWLFITVPERARDTEDRIVHRHNLNSGETEELELAGTLLDAYGHRLVMSVSESDEDEDLNDDGDPWDEVIHVHDLETDETTNLELAGSASFSGDWLVIGVPEADQSEDLNRDGDSRDSVVHIHSFESGETTNLGFHPISLHSFSGDRLFYSVSETFAGRDLNHDGDEDDVVLRLRNLKTGETMNLGLAGLVGDLSGKWLGFRVFEAMQSEDLNGDGDTTDVVFHVHNLETAETRNLKLADSHGGPEWSFTKVSGRWFVMSGYEGRQGRDLNGDGDTDDLIWHVHDLESGETRSLGLAGNGFYSASVSGNWLVIRVSEINQGEDLNDDGDAEDRGVVHVHDLESGATTNLRVGGSNGSAKVSGDWLVLGVREADQSEDLNGDGDTEDAVLHVVDLRRLDEPNTFMRGDANADDNRNLTDAAFVLEYLFGKGEKPPCVKSADANDSGTVDLTDAVYLLTFLFTGGAPPAVPFAECGRDPTVDDLSCESFPAC